jgi:plastocyanin
VHSRVRCAACAVAVVWLLFGAGCDSGEWLPEWSRRGGTTEQDSALALGAPAAGDGTVHLVRLVARGDQYAFEPAEVTIRPGDVVRFVQTGHQPEAVVFDTAQLPPSGVEVLRREGALAGPLLTTPGATWDVHFEGAPAGSYRFASIAHAETGMRGSISIAE